MKVSKGQSQPEIVAAAFLILYMVLGSPSLYQVLIETQVGMLLDTSFVPDILANLVHHRGTSIGPLEPRGGPASFPADERSAAPHGELGGPGGLQNPKAQIQSAKFGQTKRCRVRACGSGFARKYQPLSSGWVALVER